MCVCAFDVLCIYSFIALAHLAAAAFSDRAINSTGPQAVPHFGTVKQTGLQCSHVDHVFIKIAMLTPNHFLEPFLFLELPFSLALFFLLFHLDSFICFSSLSHSPLFFLRSSEL